MNPTLNRRLLVFLSLILFAGLLNAQKKLVPVNLSTLTGISLPAGTKQDSRFLSEIAGKAMLDMETKKEGVTIGKIELLVLPPTANISGTKDSLKQVLQGAGWMITPMQSGYADYFWIDRNNIRLIAYLNGNKKEISLYFGESNGQTGQAQPPYTPPSDPQQNQQVYQPDPTQQNNQPPAIQDNQPPPVLQTSSGTSGITTAITNFDDGWTASPQADWVQLNKNNLSVYLHYAIPLPDELRSGDGDPILNHFWNLLIVPRYSVSNLQKLPFDPYAYKRTYFMEASATDNATGQAVYLAFRILIDNGIASCIEIKASTKEDYTSEFPNLDKVAAMTGYNRFAIAQADITGKWVQSSGAFAQYYNVYSGNYAGMNAVSITSQLTIGTDGQLLLEHKGASGMVGNQQFFSESYKGPYALTNWDLSFTDQQGKQTAYHAFYQAVKNGRVLYLQNKQYSGQEYFFVKKE